MRQWNLDEQTPLNTSDASKQTESANKYSFGPLKLERLREKKGAALLCAVAVTTLLFALYFLVSKLSETLAVWPVDLLAFPPIPGSYRRKSSVAMKTASGLSLEQRDNSSLVLVSSMY